MARCWPRSSPWFCSRAASVPTPDLSRPLRQPPWRSLGGSQLLINAVGRGAAAPCRGRWCSRTAAAAPSEPALRGAHGRSRAVAVCGGSPSHAGVAQTRRDRRHRRSAMAWRDIVLPVLRDAGHILTVGPFTAGIFYSLPTASGRHSRDPRGRKALLGAGRCPALTRTARRAASGGILRARIEWEGPLPVDAYMRACLAHPEHGYWGSAESIGTGGDFITR